MAHEVFYILLIDNATQMRSTVEFSSQSTFRSSEDQLWEMQHLLVRNCKNAVIVVKTVKCFKYPYRLEVQKVLHCSKTYSSDFRKDVIFIIFLVSCNFYSTYQILH